MLLTLSVNFDKKNIYSNNYKIIYLFFNQEYYKNENLF